MAPSFSAQGIVQILELSYRLYNASESDQKPAASYAVELKSELFALHCALGHLRHLANDEALSLPSQGAIAQREHNLWQSLDKLVAECAATLQDLESMMPFNIDGPTERASPHDKSESGGRLAAKANLSIQEKPQLGVSESVVKRYRDKIQSHNDHINLVLNTFHWSSLREGNVQDQEKVQAMQKFQESMTNSSSDLKTLVEEILARLKNSSDGHSQIGNQYGDTSISGGYVHQGDVAGNMTVNCYVTESQPTSAVEAIRSHAKLHTPQKRPVDFRSRKGGSLSTGGAFGLNSIATVIGEPHRINQHFTDPIRMPMMSDKGFRAHGTQPSNSPFLPGKGTAPSVNPSPGIVELNKKRRSAGMKELADLRKELMPVPIPSFMDPKVPTVQDLEQGLRHIFHPITSRLIREQNPEKELRATMIIRWTQGLDSLLQAHYDAILTAKDGAGSSNAENQTAYIGLISFLNESLEGASYELRIIFYNSSITAGIDNVFEKLLTISKSVRAEKEVNEFQDEREDFGWSAR